MTESNSPTNLARFLERSRKEPFFLGHALEEYKDIRDVDDQRLEEFLECDAKALTRLALCRKPDDREARFQEDVRRIAEYVPCSADNLMILLRVVAAFSSLKEETAQSGTGLLMAARDRQRKDQAPDERTPDKGEKPQKPDSTSDE